MLIIIRAPQGPLDSSHFGLYFTLGAILHTLEFIIYYSLDGPDYGVEII